MKLILISALLFSFNVYAEKPAKNKKADALTSTSHISEKEMNEAAPFFKAMSDCKAKQMKNVDGDMAIEHEVHGLEKGKCKVTSKATIKDQLVSFTTCQLTAQDRKTVKTNGLENYSKLMMDGKTCTMETGGQKF